MAPSYSAWMKEALAGDRRHVTVRRSLTGSRALHRSRSVEVDGFSANGTDSRDAPTRSTRARGPSRRRSSSRWRSIARVRRRRCSPSCLRGRGSAPAVRNAGDRAPPRPPSAPPRTPNATAGPTSAQSPPTSTEATRSPDAVDGVDPAEGASAPARRARGRRPTRARLPPRSRRGCRRARARAPPAGIEAGGTTGHDGRRGADRVAAREHAFAAEAIGQPAAGERGDDRDGVEAGVEQDRRRDSRRHDRSRRRLRSPRARARSSRSRRSRTRTARSGTSGTTAAARDRKQGAARPQPADGAGSGRSRTSTIIASAASRPGTIAQSTIALDGEAGLKEQR